MMMSSPQQLILSLQQTLHLANTTDCDYVSDTGLYMEINESYMNVLPPTVKTEENPAYGKGLNDDYV